MGTIFDYNNLEKKIQAHGKSFSGEKIQEIMQKFYEVLSQPFANKLLHQLKKNNLEIPLALLQNFKQQIKF
ncbi:MAG: hypothetical protein LBG59_00100 [Candidatus Peribacteria bacterium]|jgi:hypothetical protein|nr:hypothetical protein [Candidatus Peribacteria bacterium]